MDRSIGWKTSSSDISPGVIRLHGYPVERSISTIARAWEESRSGHRNKGPEHRSVLPDYVGPAPRDVI